MAPSTTPSWVVNDLSMVLGLDDETIKQMIIPDLESYTHEARLRVHLQDFLGPSNEAKSFTTRYISFRFPSLTSLTSTSVSSIPSQSIPSNSLLKPIPTTTSQIQAKGKPSGKASASKSSSPLSLSRPTSNAGSSRLPPSSQTPTHTQNQTQNIPEALEAAFGPGGKVYQKKRESDLLDSGWGKPSSSSSHGHSHGHGISRTGSGLGSGSNSAAPSGTTTPSGINTHGHGQTPVQRVRHAGAVNIQTYKPKPRLDTPPIGTTTIDSRSNSSKGKNRSSAEKIWDTPKSKQVKKLENVKEKLRILKEGEGKIHQDDNTLKCFCQARVHPLSTYTPLCQSCGLVICSLQLPYLPCPSCSNPLSTPAQLARLILRIEGEIESQLAKEEREREQIERDRLARLAADAGGGSFPTLPGSNTSQQQITTSVGGRKVLTIASSKNTHGKGGKGKSKITSTTYFPQSSSSTTSSRPITPPPETIPRLRMNPLDIQKIEKELKKLLNLRDESDRSWADLKPDKRNDGLQLEYKELPVVHINPENTMGRRKKGKARKLGEGGREVPGAGA
ncbi:uncharacterized protein IL334_004009 [Kwoniella shivajii]|uniref:TRIP4/RQT4 C2HC5-type zinc finger domain-containing protein n=1 Tax=Kwoniella shivajii TaxID=564305 RepID=A0ABZ1CZ52_9TREE|nr:hypothetical protein IL334_004009 [Kwoniella shivajii]